MSNKLVLHAVEMRSAFAGLFSCPNLKGLVEQETLRNPRQERQRRL